MKLTPIQDMPDAVSQRGIWAGHRAEARSALVAAANTLAPLSGSDPIDLAKFAKHKDEPSPSAVAETAAAAVVAESVLVLLARIEALEAKLAAQEGN